MEWPIRLCFLGSFCFRGHSFETLSLSLSCVSLLLLVFAALCYRLRVNCRTRTTEGVVTAGRFTTFNEVVKTVSTLCFPCYTRFSANIFFLKHRTLRGVIGWKMFACAEARLDLNASLACYRTPQVQRRLGFRSLSILSFDGYNVPPLASLELFLLC